MGAEHLLAQLLGEFLQQRPREIVVSVAGLVFGLWLTRGLGQSALSAGSLTLAGIAARNRPPSVMAIYSILLSVGFMIAFPVVGAVVGSAGWRPAWAMVGTGLLVLAAVSFAILRRSNGPDGDSAPDVARPELTRPGGKAREPNPKVRLVRCS